MNFYKTPEKTFPVDFESFQPLYMAMIEDAIYRLGDNVTAQQIKKYIERHYDLCGDQQIDVHLAEAIRRLCELNEIQRTGTSKFARFSLPAHPSKALFIIPEDPITTPNQYLTEEIRQSS